MKLIKIGPNENEVSIGEAGDYCIILFSYETPVAAMCYSYGGKQKRCIRVAVRELAAPTKTTNRHIDAFFKRHTPRIDVEEVNLGAIDDIPYVTF